MSAYPPTGMWGPRAISWWALRTQASHVTVDGLDHVPASGPVLLVARHVHHLLDGAVLTERLPRPVHIVVGLDWAENARQRRWMERACALAQYPVILRPTSLGERAGYARAELNRYLREGIRAAARLLDAGRVVLVFPEGYPLVDPSPPAQPPARDDAGFAPFARGFAAIARATRRDVPLVPVGFRYTRDGARWSIRARLGAPLPRETAPAALERAVRELSR